DAQLGSGGHARVEARRTVTPHPGRWLTAAVTIAVTVAGVAVTVAAAVPRLARGFAPRRIGRVVLVARAQGHRPPQHSDHSHDRAIFAHAQGLPAPRSPLHDPVASVLDLTPRTLARSAILRALVTDDGIRHGLEEHSTWPSDSATPPPTSPPRPPRASST